MKYFLHNIDIEDQVKAIQKTILLSMNGISSDRMKESGINYEKNFGLSLPRIKEIAKLYKKNSLFAERLWSLKIRETQIIATLLYPAEQFSLSKAVEWSQNINNSELCEQFAFNIAQYSNQSSEIIFKFINTANPYLTTTAFLISSRAKDKLSTKECTEIINKALEKSATTEFYQYHSIAVCLRFFCRKQKSLADEILMKINAYKDSGFQSQKYIYQEVQNEHSFLYEKSN